MYVCICVTRCICAFVYVCMHACGNVMCIFVYVCSVCTSICAYVYICVCRSVNATNLTEFFGPFVAEK